MQFIQSLKIERIAHGLVEEFVLCSTSANYR